MVGWMCHIVALVGLIFGPSYCRAKQTPINFVIFEEGENDVGTKLIEVGAKELKGSEYSIGKVHRLSVTPTTNWTNFYEEKWMPILESEERPSFALDFSASDYASLVIKTFVREAGLPTISTKTQSLRMTVRNQNRTEQKLVGWKQLEPNVRKFLIQVKSPEAIFGLAAVRIVDMTKTLSGATLSRNILKRAYIAHINKTLVADTAVFGRVKKYSIVPPYLEALKAKMFFVFGSPIQISTIFKELSNSSVNVFDDQYSLWAFSTETKTEIELPENVRQIMVCTPEISFPGFEKKMKTAKTHNITELFYLDMILGTIRAVGRMKKEELWTDPDPKNLTTVDLDLRSYLAEELTGEGNFLGKYAMYGKDLAPNLKTFSMDLATPSDSKVVGKLKFSADFSNTTIDKEAKKPFLSHLPITYVKAVVVVDPPFVIKNESCIDDNEFGNKHTISCYSGFVIDILNKMRKPFPRWKWIVKAEDIYGSEAKNSSWTGAIGSIFRNETEVGIGAFSEDEERPVRFSVPFFNSTKNGNQNYSFAVSDNGITIKSILSLMIKILKKDGYLEELAEKWFENNKKYESYKFSEH